jgi:8-amino-7-oxononanoate synthase
MALPQTLQRELDQRRQQGLYRYRKLLDSAQGVRVQINGRTYVSFCSNDYLGLANHSKVVEAFKRGADRYGVGSGASHLLTGHSRAHHQLEEELAAFTGRERALVFSSGYMANLGLLSALAGKGDFVLEDKLNHASLIDGGLLCGARFRRYLHGDAASLEKQLIRTGKQAHDKTAYGRKLVVSDGVFSMDGDLAPLSQLSQIAKQHGAILIVDDAHGFGVLGEQGAGCAEYFDLDQQQLPVLMGTLGKALGTAGAFVAGSESLIDYLIQFARPYIYTTALPSAVAEASRCALKLLTDEGERRERLHQHIAFFSQAAVQRGIPVLPSVTAIQPVMIGDNQRVMQIAQQLEQTGLLAGAIRPPTVPVGSARLRITLSADHTQTEIEDLLDTLEQLLHD